MPDGAGAVSFKNEGAGMPQHEPIKPSSEITVRLVKNVASDDDVTQAARVSTLGELAQERAVDIKRDEGLINFLMRDRHGSPFEHTSMTFFVHAPIFVFREWQRHRAGWSYNEESGRYRELEPHFYVPSVARPVVQQGKPGKYEYVGGTPEQYALTVDTLTGAYREAYERYETLLHNGVAREVARMALPVGIYSSMYATCNARSLMHFLSLRTKDPRATVPSSPQFEIDVAARMLEKHFSRLMPLTHAAFNTHGRVAP